MTAAASGRAWRVAGPVVAALALAVVVPLALAATPRTIVVRGRTLSPDGKPLAGARVMARGSVSVSALTDERGRYTLSLPLGMAAALRRLPFRMEVRVEAQGRRLPLAGGGAALELQADWHESDGRVHVRSNLEAAATAVATAIEVEGVPVAWIEADFGGGAGGGAAGSFERTATLGAAGPLPPTETPPMPPAPVAVVRGDSVPATAAPSAAPPAVPTPARADLAPPVVVTPAGADSAPPASALARADSASPAGAPPARANLAPPASAGPAGAPLARANLAPPVVVTPAGADSAPPAVATPSGPTAVDRDRATATTPAPGPAPRNGARAPAPGSPRIVANTRTGAAPPPRNSAVRAIDPYAPRDSVPRADSCRCSLRGTVEIDWDRPLETHTPVRVELDAPGAKPVEVSLFMGAPREFRFGPLPCGDWRLTVHAGGKLRYAEARGDSARVVNCAGATETRIVLSPVRR